MKNSRTYGLKLNMLIRRSPYIVFETLRKLFFKKCCKDDGIVHANFERLDKHTRDSLYDIY